MVAFRHYSETARFFNSLRCAATAVSFGSIRRCRRSRWTATVRGVLSDAW